MEKLCTWLDQERGRLSELAAACSVSHSAVWQWKKAKVPADKVIVVEGVTGISRHDLRPDVFGPPEKTGRAA